MCLLLCIVATSSAIVALVRVGSGAVPTRVPPYVPGLLIVAGVLGVGGAIFLAFAATVLSIGVG